MLLHEEEGSIGKNKWWWRRCAGVQVGRRHNGTAGRRPLGAQQLRHQWGVDPGFAEVTRIPDHAESLITAGQRKVEEVPVVLDVFLLIIGHLELVGDRFDRAVRFARTAINAFIGLHIHLVLALVDAVDWAGFDAALIEYIGASTGDYKCHDSPFTQVGDVLSEPPLSVLVHDDAADVLVVVEIGVALVDLIEGVCLGDQLVELDMSGPVQVQQLRDVVDRIAAAI